MAADVLLATWEHLWLTGISVGLAIAVGVPLGAWIVRHRFLSGPVLAAVGVIQTIPSLALLGLFVPLLGVGVAPALVALFLYALLPIVRATFTGLDGVDPRALDAARGMGMTPAQVLRQVALPQALPVIMSGVRTSTVINVGVATLAGFIGAGGLGALINMGLAMVDWQRIAMGAVPAAALALALDFALSRIERRLVPRGLRLP
ncbi:MAG: ABC transporter permease [Myxococcota bacterium]